MSCERCNEERARHSKFCAYCGSDLTVPNDGAPCSNCAICRRMGHRFCNVCGRDVSSDPLESYVCPGCDEYRREGYRFCAICGRPLDRKHDVPAMRGKGIPISFLLMSMCILMCLYVLFYEAYTAVVKVPYLMEAFEGHTFSMFIITPEVTRIFDLNDTGIRILYIVELIAVLASIGYLLYAAVRKSLGSENKTEDLKETGLYEALCLNSLLLLFQVFYIMICMANGADIEGSEFESVEEGMLALMNASVYEEFLCRICLLGLPIMIISLLIGNKDVPAYRYLIGGFKFRKWMMAFVVFSAAFFALGHLSGWGTWKLLPTFLFGMITAYLFIKYGLYATISIHFLTDFMMSETWLTGNDAALTLAGLMLLSGLVALGTIPFYLRKIRSSISELVSTKK